MSSIAGKKVLITGGASGIGKIMSRLMLERKAEVIIWDIDQNKMNETQTELSSMGDISAYKIDISKPAEIQEMAKKVKSEHGVVDMLINNAGIIVGKNFSDHTSLEILKTMEINATAPMLITSEFLKDMIHQDSGHICNIASSGGLISNPKMSVYAGSKWSLIGWSDSLRLEMQQQKLNVKVTTVLPYYINTGMFDGVQSKIKILDPEKAALTIINAIEKDKIMLTIPGYIYRLTKLGQAMFSTKGFDWLAGSVFGIYKTMDHFTGRKDLD